MQFKHTSDLMSFIPIWNGTFLDLKKKQKKITKYIFSYCSSNKDYDIRYMHWTVKNIRRTKRMSFFHLFYRKMKQKLRLFTKVMPCIFAK